MLYEDDQEHCKRKLCLPLLEARTSYKPMSSFRQSSTSGLSAVDRDTLKKYYYKQEENYQNKFRFDEDFVLTDREIDNLFDLTSHLPENHGKIVIKLLSKNIFFIHCRHKLIEN